MGEETEGLANGLSKYREEIKALSGVDIMVNDTTYKDMYDIFVELAQVWDNMEGGTAQARVAEILGGTRNLSGVMSTINNISDAIGAYEGAMNAAGTATKANDIYMDTTSAHIEQLKASFQELAANVFQGDLTKQVVDFGKGLVEIANQAVTVVNAIGGLKTVLIGVAGAFALVKRGSIADTFSKIGEKSTGLVKDLLRLPSVFSKAGSAIKSFASGGATIASTLSAIGPAAAITVAGIAGVVAVIHTLVQARKQYLEEQVTSASEAAEDISKERNDLEQRLERAKELRAQLDAGNLSEQETYQIKTDLLSIQQEIVGQYGEQASQINLINGSLEDQLKIVSDINRQQASDFLSENREGIEEATKRMQKDVGGELAPFYAGSEADGIKQSMEEQILRDIFDKYEGFSFSERDIEGLVTPSFHGSVLDGAKEILTDVLTELRKAQEKYGESAYLEAVADTLSGYLDDATSILDKNEALYNESRLQELIEKDAKWFVRGTDGNPPSESKTLAEWLGAYKQAIKDYNDALVSGEDISEYAANFAQIDDYVTKIGKQSGFADVFASAREELNQSLIDYNKLLDVVSGKDESFGNEIKDYADALKEFGLTDTDFKHAFFTQGVQEGEDAVNNLVKALQDAGLIAGDTFGDITESDLMPLVKVLLQLGSLTAPVAEGIEQIGKSFRDLLKNDDNAAFISNMQNDMASLQNTIDQINKGETSGINLTELMQEFDGISGNLSSLGEELGQVQYEKIKSFASTWKSMVSELTDPEEIAKANSFFDTFVQSLDFSNIDVDVKDIFDETVYSSITEGLTQSEIDLVNAYRSAVEARDERVSEYVGNVDITHRQVRPNANGAYSILEPQSFPYSEFGIDKEGVFTVTPILPDGQRIQDLGLYIENQLQDHKVNIEDLPIYLGSFESVEEATDEMAALNDRLLEIYTPEIEAMKNLGVGGLSDLTKLSQEEWSDLKAAYNNYTAELESFNKNIAENVRNPEQTIFGNIDLNNRKNLTWTPENLEQYKTALQSWSDEALNSWDTYASEMEDTISNVSAEVLEVEGDFGNFLITLSPMLQTENGAELLSADTVISYIEELMNQVNDGDFSFDEIFTLDKEGLDINGKHIQGLIADIGETAKDTEKDLDYLEPNGSLVKGYKDFADKAQKAGHSVEEVSDAIEDGNKIGAASGEVIGRINDLYREFESEISTDQGRNILYKLSLDTSSAEWSMDDWRRKYQEEEINVRFNTTNETIQATTDQINKLKAALSEQSNGYLSAKTIQDLTAANQVYNEALINTSSGMVLDTKKARELATEQGNLNMVVVKAAREADELNYKQNAEQMVELAGSAEELNRILANGPDGDEYAEIFELADANETLASHIQYWQDVESEIRGSISLLQQYNEAQSTPNLSDPYNTFVAGMQNAKDLFDQGWIGKDDVTTYAMAIAGYGQSEDEAIASFSENLARMERYFTEDTSGLKNFLDDAVQKSEELGENWVKLTENGGYDFDIKNMDDFAKAMDMQTESIEYFLLALNDAGFSIDLSWLGDTLISDIQSIDTTATGAAEHIKQIVQWMGQLSSAGFDVSGAIDPLLSALRSLSEQGANVQEIVEMINSLGVIQIDPITLEVKTEETGETVDDIVAKNSGKSVDITANVVQGTTVDSVTADTTSSSVVNYTAGEQEPPEPQSTTVLYQNDAAHQGKPLDQTANVTYVIAEEDGQEPPKDENANLLYVIEKQEEPHPEEADLDYRLRNQDNPRSKETRVNYILGTQELPKEQYVKIHYVANPPTTHSSSNQQSKVATASGTAQISSQMLRPPVSQTVQSAREAGTIVNAMRSKGAFSFGADWELHRDEDALVNEIGNESIVRDGKWFVLQGNAHVEHLRKGDIIFSAKQTEELIKYGKVMSDGGRGRVAMSNGTAQPGMHAYAVLSQSAETGGINIGKSKGPVDVNIVGDSRKSTTGHGTFLNNKDTTSATGGGKFGGGGGSSGSDDSGKGLAQNMQSAAESSEEVKANLKDVVDHVAERLDDLQKRTENYIQKAEDATTLSSRLKYYQKAIDNIPKEIEAQTEGRRRYLEYAKDVVKQSNGKLTPEIVKRINNGELSKGDAIKEYDDETRQYIEEYSEWREKAEQCSEAIKDLNVQQRELAKTKLDAIVDKYDLKISKADVDIERNNARLEYRETAGKSNVGATQKRILENSRDHEAERLKKLQNAQALYQAELEKQMKAGTIKKFDDAWYEAQNQLEEYNTEIYETMNAMEEFEQQIRAIKLTKLQRILDVFQRAGDLLASKLGLKEARGEKITEQDYMQQVTNNNDQINAEYEKLKGLLEEQSHYDPGSEKWQEYSEQIADCKNGIFDLLTENERLKDSIVEVRWSEFTELQEQVDNTIVELDFLRGMLNEPVDMMANITEEGHAHIALLGEAMKAEKQTIADYNQAIKKLGEDLANGNISQSEYNEKLLEFQGVIRDSAQAVKDYEQELIDIWIDQAETRNDLLQDEITLRQDALKSMKDYHDYAKTVKDKTGDIDSLKAQIAALEGVTNAADRAQLRKLKAQLKEAEEELDEINYEHEYELKITGYDRLKEEAQTQLDIVLDALSTNADMQRNVVGLMLSDIQTNYQTAYGVVNDLVTNTGLNISDMTQQSIQDFNNMTQAAQLAAQAALQASQYSPSDTSTNIETGHIDTSTDSNGNSTKPAEEAAGVDQQKQEMDSYLDHNPPPTTGEPPLPPANEKEEEEEPFVVDKTLVRRIINSGKPHPKPLTKDEQDRHHEVWEYITTRYKKQPWGETYYQRLADALGVKLGDPNNMLKSEKNAMLNALIANGFAKGGYVDSYIPVDPATAIGSIVTRNGDKGFVSVAPGEYILNANQTDRFLDVLEPAINNLNGFNKAYETMSGGALQSSDGPISFDSVIKVMGNVDRDVYGDIETLGKQLIHSKNFTDGITTAVGRTVKRDATKLGMRTRI